MLLKSRALSAAAYAHGSGLLQFSAQTNNTLAWGKDTVRPMYLGSTHDSGPFFTHLRLQCSALIPVIPPAGSPHFEEGALFFNGLSPRSRQLVVDTCKTGSMYTVAI
jgi:hypothetical protein